VASPDDAPGVDPRRLASDVRAHVELCRWLGQEYARLGGIDPASLLAPIETEPRPMPPSQSRPAQSPESARSAFSPKSARPPKPAARPKIIKAEGEDPDKRRRLNELYDEFSQCHQCALATSRQQFVFGEGRSDARLMFVGEAPGRDEDEQGRPFVGRAGKLLTKMINAMGLRREDVYIGNILKCRPPQNRTPTVSEMAVCLPYILKQIEVIEPEVICALGATALKGLLRDPRASIGRMRGTFIDWHGCKLMPTYHPAYLLRSPGEKKKAWSDLQEVMAELRIEPPDGAG
jgi:DNA polymerase